MSSRLRRFALPSGGWLELDQGDLTQWRGDALVNAANSRMLGGGGVDGAIHRAAGPELREACARVPEVAPGVRCPTGQARITPSFGRLQVRYVIHTVGPVYRNPGESGPLLGSAYRSSLACARGQGLTSIAFPAISCGVYGYPLAEAADLAVSTCREHAGELEKVAFILFSAEVWEQWLAAAERQLP